MTICLPVRVPVTPILGFSRSCSRSSLLLASATERAGDHLPLPPPKDLFLKQCQLQAWLSKRRSSKRTRSRTGPLWICWGGGGGGHCVWLVAPLHWSTSSANQHKFLATTYVLSTNYACLSCYFLQAYCIQLLLLVTITQLPHCQTCMFVPLKCWSLNF